MASMDAKHLVEARARAARAGARALALCSTRIKNDALGQMARALEEKAAALLDANRADVERARADGHPRAFLDRLTLTEPRIEEMASGLRQIATLPDPVGSVVETWRRPNGLEISRVRVPLGVVGFIYESRPNVTADAVGLCLKSGNAVILRGGSEAIESNAMIAAVLAKAAEKAGAPSEAIQFIDTTDRAAVAAMLELSDLLDLVIPRGGEAFVRWVAEHSRVPVLKHDRGLVHVFVDADADLEMARAIVVNAKAQRPSVCNALETLLVHRDVAARFLPLAAQRLAEAGVDLRGIGLISCSPYTGDLDTPSNKKLIDRMVKEYGNIPGLYSAGLYINGQVAEAALEKTGGKTEDRDALIKAMRAVSLTDTPRGPFSFDRLGNVVGSFYIRRMEMKGGKLVNTTIKTYPKVSQFWTYEEKWFLSQPVYSRDFPPLKS
jgi:glutamate-5-semialdehyde dehydrogenase